MASSEISRWSGFWASARRTSISAVSVSVNRYFSPATKMTQCQVALAVTGKKDCCGNPEDCNDAGDLEVALTAVNHFEEMLVGALSFDDIRSEIDACRPVCARIGWRNGGGHFVILTGYRLLATGKQLVEVADPFFADSIMSYRHFVNAYGSAAQPGGGQWTHTFKLHP